MSEIVVDAIRPGFGQVGDVDQYRSAINAIEETETNQKNTTQQRTDTHDPYDQSMNTYTEENMRRLSCVVLVDASASMENIQKQELLSALAEFAFDCPEDADTIEQNDSELHNSANCAVVKTNILRENNGENRITQHMQSMEKSSQKRLRQICRQLSDTYFLPKLDRRRPCYVT